MDYIFSLIDSIFIKFPFTVFFFENYMFAASVSVFLAVLTLIKYPALTEQKRKNIELIWTLALPAYFFFETHWVYKYNMTEFINYEHKHAMVMFFWTVFMCGLKYFPIIKTQ